MILLNEAEAVGMHNGVDAARQLQLRAHIHKIKPRAWGQASMLLSFPLHFSLQMTYPHGQFGLFLNAIGQAAHGGTNTPHIPVHKPGDIGKGHAARFTGQQTCHRASLRGGSLL